MRRVRLSHKLILFVLVLALMEGGLMGWLLYAAGVPRPSFIFLAGGVGAFLTGLVGLFVIRQVTRPLEQMTAAAKRMGEGDLEVDIEVRSHDELGVLADAFRTMRDRLAENYALLESRVAERTEELRSTSDFLQSILDSATEYAIIATDTKWRMLTFNEGAVRTYGYQPEEVIGRKLDMLVPADEAEAALGDEVQRHLAEHGRHEGEGIRVRADGERFPVRTVTTVRRSPDRDTIGYTIICRDITQRRALEARLREYTDNLERMVAEKTAELQQVNAELRRANRLKSQFLANMSHELRTPLNAIIGFAEAIRDGVAGEVADEAREFAEDINQAGHQLLSMINNVLDFSKVEAGAMDLDLQPCDLVAIVQDCFRVIRSLAARQGVNLRHDIQPEPFELTIDPVKLKQVLYNLLANAVKFTEPGGWVEVRARMEPETAVVEVEDTGVGIAPEDQAWVFEEFRRGETSHARAREGTGLGLALVKRLVELHGGMIEVESKLGEGTTFRITLLRDLVTEQEMRQTASGGEADTGTQAEADHD